MVYAMDDDQLLRVWSVIRCFAEIRENKDPVIQSEILTNAQLLLTAFVLDLNPWRRDQTGSTPPRTQYRSMVAPHA
jgi:hypothetical protein